MGVGENMAGPGFKEALMKEGGCGLLIYAVGAFMIGGFIYYFVLGFGVDPDVKNIMHSCWDRETARIGRPGVDLSEQERIWVVQRCDVVVKDYLDAKRRREAR